jgi:multisubunit Na+/H+ antiporter MnhG subunit
MPTAIKLFASSILCVIASITILVETLSFSRNLLVIIVNLLIIIITSLVETLAIKQHSTQLKNQLQNQDKIQGENKENG